MVHPRVDPTDAAVLEAWRAGDEAAGEELFRRHFPAIARFFRNKVHTDIEELIQTTFLGCIEGSGRVREDGSFRGFLFGLARNTLCNHFRRQRAHGKEFDVEQVSHVISFDMPNTPDAYTHRIGRTGRSEREGQAFTFVTGEDIQMVREV